MRPTASSILAAAVGFWGAFAACPLLAQTDGTDVYQTVIKREFGTASNELAAIEKEIANTRPDQYSAIEARLIAVIETPGATMPGRQFACQMLRTVGSLKCVPTVSRLLTDEQLSHVARQVFLGLHGSAVEDSLRKALGQTQGNLRIGIINTIGDRRDRSSINAVAALVKENDPAMARAGLNALGKIGGPPAAAALDRLKEVDALKPAWADASLRCASGLVKAGDSKRAEKIYRSLFDGGYPSPVRAGAFGGLVQIQQDQAVPLIVKTFASNDPLLRRAAAAGVSAIPGHAATDAFARELATMAPEGKVTLLGALAARGDAEGLTETVNKLASDQDPAIRSAAIKALARLGNASSVPVLASTLKDGSVPETVTTLVNLQGEGVAAALIKQFDSGEVSVRQGVLGALAARHEAEALPVVRKAVTDDDAKIRQAALKALGTLGTRDDFARLTDVLLATKDEPGRDLLAQAMSAIGERLPDKATRCQPVVQALLKADAPSKISLLAVLSALGGEPALQAVRESLAGDGQVRQAAIKALADWPDPAAMPDLLALAKEDKDKANQNLALRSYIRMAGTSGGTREKKVQSYREAMELAVRPDEKRLVLAGLGEVAHIDALKLVEASLEDPDVKSQAFGACEKLGESLASRQPAAAKEALERVAANAPDAGLRNKAKQALEKMK